MPEDHLQALPNGHRIDEYEIVRVLGTGGFGITYLAFDHNLRAPVAIKEYFYAGLVTRTVGGAVAPSSAGEAEGFEWGRARFLDEARLLARLDHPNVVRVRRCIEANDTAYIVMDYVEGESLAAVLEKHGALTPPEWRRWLEPLLDGLQYVHRRDYLHRDVKPANIVIRAEDGEPVLIDFGSARSAAGEKTRHLTAIHTPGYAPIEQYSASSRQSPATDIYGLAAVSYRVLTGEPPPAAPDRMLDDTCRPLADQIGGADRAWLAALDRGLALRPEDRPETVESWRAALASAGLAPAVDVSPTVDARRRPQSMGEGRASLESFPDSPPPEPPAPLGRAVQGALPHAQRAAHRVRSRTDTPSDERRDVPDDAARPWWRTAAAASATLLATALLTGWIVGLPDQNTATRPETTARERQPEPQTPLRTRRPAPAPPVPAPAVEPAGAAPGERRDPIRPSPEEAEEARLGLGRADRRAIQAGLAAAGFDPGAADGVFGPRTRAALRRWQADRGVSATGYLTLADVSALRAVAAALPPPTRGSRSASGRSITVFSIEEAITDTLGFGGDRWSLVAEAGEQFSIWLESEDFDTQLRIRSPGGEVVDFDDDGGYGTNSLIEMIAAHSGQYVMEVTSYETGGTGSYDLTVLAVNRPRVLEDPDSSDLGLFFAESGDELDISVMSDDFDTYVLVTTPSGEIVEDDDGGVGLNSRIEMIAEEEGPHLVAVASVGNQAGAYEIFVSVR